MKIIGFIEKTVQPSNTQMGSVFGGGTENIYRAFQLKKSFNLIYVTKLFGNSQMKIEYFILASIFGWGMGSFFYKIANTSIHPIMVSTIAMGLYIVLLPLIWLVVKFDHTITT